MSQMNYDADELLGTISQKMLDDVKFLGKEIQDLINALKAKESKLTTLNTDMAYIVMVVSLRGTNMEKFDTRTSPEGKRMFNMLKNKYGIVPHAKTVPMKTPTLPRIVSLYPVLSMKLRQNYTLPLIGNDKLIKQEFCFPSAGSIINDESIENWLEWYESFCNKVEIIYDRNNALLGNKFSTMDQKDRYDCRLD